MFIRSERLFLRPAWPEECPELDGLLLGDAQACGAPQVPSRHPRFVITVPDQRGADVIGVIGLIDREGATELAVWIAPDWCNQGFATEAARATLTIARTLGHCRLVSNHYADSPATARVLAKLGFLPTGDVRMRHSPVRHRDELAQVHVLDLCPTASDPVDPEFMRHAA